RTRPGKIGRPAASVEVQPSGRIALDFRSKTAPLFAFQRPLLCGNAPNISYSFQLSRSMTIAVSVRAAFDWSVAWDWIRTRIAFGAVRREVDRNAWLRSRHDDIGNAVR